MLPPLAEQTSYTNGSAAGLPDRSRGNVALVPTSYESAIEMPALPSWQGTPVQKPTALTAPPTPLSLLGALRRRWFLATALGVTLGAMLAALPWFLMPTKYQATSWLRAEIMPPANIFAERVGPEEFVTFKRTQTTMMTNPFVLNVALRDENVGKAPMIMAEADQVTFLAKNIVASFPGDGQLLSVSLWGQDPGELKEIVDGVVKAYLKEVVGQDRLVRDARYTKLNDILRKNRGEITSMREKIETLAASTGSISNESVKRKLEAFDRDLLTTHEEVIIAKRHVNDLEMQVGLSTAKLNQAQSEEPLVTEAMIDEYLKDNVEYQALQKNLMDLRVAFESRRATARGNASAANRMLQAMEDKLAQLQDDMAQRRAQARQELIVLVKQENVTKTRNELANYNVELKLRRDHLRKAEDRLAGMQAQVVNLTKQSSELQSKSAELKELEEVTAKIATEVNQLRIELDSPERVRLLDPAAIQGNNLMTKYGIVLICGVLGMLGSLVGVALLEFNSRRIANVNEVGEGLGMKVIGVLPHLSTRGARGAAVRGMLAESIDGIRTSLLHSERGDSLRVILVTSAVAREGKTTVATQLAASLARAGRRTLLVDADLRSPSAHRLYEMPLEPGLCEVLRGETELDDAIRPTRAAGLWIVAAGKVCRECIHALAKNELRQLFARMRCEFDYVVIDAAPVLSTADTLTVGQHADGVVLSVLRSSSRAPKVYEACERLESVGIAVLGTVVNGVDTPLVRRMPELPGTGGPGTGEGKPAKVAKAKPAKPAAKPRGKAKTPA
ncbi:MAG: polysaccharide biosynthesis tyrosine autokinase [Pirellulales bacterium]|nr:polysaccharide biosynthesis tyrosine autokinase [Pirellulales bacterium]